MDVAIIPIVLILLGNGLSRSCVLIAKSIWLFVRKVVTLSVSIRNVLEVKTSDQHFCNWSGVGR